MSEVIPDQTISGEILDADDAGGSLDEITEASPTEESIEDDTNTTVSGASPENPISENVSVGETTPQENFESVDGEPRENISQIINTLDVIKLQLDDLTTQFKSKISRSEYEEKTLKQFSDEIQEYRSDLYKKITMPLLKELMEFRNNLFSSIQRAYAKNPENPVIKTNTIETYCDMLENVLENYSVEIYSPELGSKLTPGKEKPVGKVKTGDESLHGTLAEVSCDGYLVEGKCVMPAMVKVYTYEESLSKATNPEIVEPEAPIESQTEPRELNPMEMQTPALSNEESEQLAPSQASDPNM